MVHTFTFTLFKYIYPQQVCLTSSSSPLQQASNRTHWHCNRRKSEHRNAVENTLSIGPLSRPVQPGYGHIEIDIGASGMWTML